MIKKKILSIILAGALVFCMLPAGAFAAVGTVIEVSDSGALSAALQDSASGDTIRLTANIDHNEGISISGKAITFDLNTYTLSVTSGEDNGLEVGSGGVVEITGAGALNVLCTWDIGDGVYAYGGGRATVTNAAATGSAGYGAHTFETGSYIRVTGNATGVEYGVYANEGTVIVGGDATATGEDAAGVFAGGGSIVNVGGDAIAAGNNSCGAFALGGGTVSVGGSVAGSICGAQAAGSGSLIEVAGDVTSTEEGGVGVDAFIGGAVRVARNVDSSGNYCIGVSADDSGSTAVVEGSVTASGTNAVGVYACWPGSSATVNGSVTASETGAIGVFAEYGGTVTINDSITAPVYIMLQESNKTEGEGVPGEGDYASYLVYTDESNTVYVNTGAVCWIGAAHYETLDAALGAVLSGETIRLVKTITDEDGISLSGRNFILDLNGHILSVTSSSGPGLNVANGTVNIAGSGTLNAASSASHGLDVGIGGVVDITGDGALNVSSSATLCEGSVYAHNGGQAEVTSAEVTGENSIGVYAMGAGSHITVTGDVAANAANCAGVYTVFGGTVDIGGNVEGSGSGVQAYDGGTATIEGTIDAPVYIVLQYLGKAAGEWTGENEDYLIYSDGTNTVYVMTINAAISPASAEFNKDPGNEDHKDIITTITWNDASSVTGVKKDGVSIGSENYSIDGNSLTIKTDYLKYKPAVPLALTIEFNAGDDATLTINVVDNRTPVCEIGTAQYTSLEEALMSIGNGEDKTIKLLDDIDYNNGIEIEGRSITFDLNDHTLSVTNNAGHGLNVGSGGVADITGDGALNVISNANDGCGVSARAGGRATVTSATSNGVGAFGAYAAGADSHVTVTGDITSQVYGAYATDGGTISVGGNVEGNYVGADAVGADSLVEVAHNVTATDGGCYGVYAYDGGNVLVGGDVTAGGASSTGADASYLGTATIEGKINVQPDSVYIRVHGSGKTATEGQVGSGTDTGYFVFTESGSTVRVKIKSADIDPDTVQFSKYTAVEDVVITITWNDTESLTDVKAGGTSIGTENYSLDGDELTIKKEYLAGQPLGELVLSVEFDVGAPATLTVNIVARTITVTFNAAGGKVSTAGKQVATGAAYGELPVPTRTYYYFFGWYTGTNGSGDLVEADDIVDAADGVTQIVLYARWVSNSSVALSIPSFSVKATDYKTITLTWKAVKGAEGYEVWRKEGSVYKFYKDFNKDTLSYKDEDLATGVTRYYKIRSYHTPYLVKVYSGASSYRYAKPAWPSVSMKAVSSTYNSIKLTWKTVAGATAYEVQRYINGKYVALEIDPSEFDTTVAGYVSYTNTGLSTGVKYYYKVRAYDADNTGNNGVLSSYRYATPAWPSVSMKAVSSTYNSIKLTWKTVAGATAYEVQRYDTAAGKYVALEIDPSEFDTTVAGYVSYTNTGLSTGVRYYYKVRAYDGANSTLSSSRYATPAWPTVSMKAVSSTYNSIKLTWKTVTGATAYEVQRYDTAAGKYVALEIDPSEFDTTVAGYVSYTDTGLSKGVKYYYKVRAYDGANSTLSSSRYATPAWPTVNLKAVSSTYNSIKLTWKTVAGATAYEVQRYINGKYVALEIDPSEFDTTVAGYVSYTDTGLSKGVKYYYKVRAYDGANSTLSSSRYATPAWPTVSMKAVSSTYNSIKLTWKTVAGATAYEVQRYINGKYVALEIDPSEFDTTVAGYVSYTDTGLSKGVKYYYKVRAYDGANSTLSSYRYATPAWPTVSLKAVSSTYNSIKLTWNVTAGATAYEVQRYINGKYVALEIDPSEFDTTVAGYVSYTDTGLSAGVKYYYKVRAYDGANSTLSSYRYAYPVPKAPATIALERTSAVSIKVSWDAVEGASGYEIYRATSLKGKYTKVATVTAGLSYENTGLYVSKTYYYAVRAYTKVGSVTGYGPFSGKKFL